ncbi:kinase-like domain-containing protein [Kalaharituber pfeilii]|nr:kinase-like domain-containing protein [Kalaharituber pfeilii]
MPPKKDQTALKRNLPPSSPSSPESLSKKPRRSSRINPLKEPEPETERLEQTASPSRPAGPGAPTPTSSPPPADTQVASQVYFSSAAENKEEAKDVWGYLTPMNSVHGEVLTLSKRSGCSKKTDTSTGNKKSGKKGTVGTSGYLIGRHPECDIVVDSPVVSNRHCVIFKETAGAEPLAIVEDLSSNGTFVNGTIVGRNKRRSLKQGDEITVAGGAVFVFRYPHHATAGRFEDSYTLGQRLGSGHFATVHIATEKRTGNNFAVKIFKKPKTDEKSRLTGLHQEVAVLMSVSHPNVLCLKETFDEDDGVYLVLELANEGELFEYIIQKGKLSESDSRKVFIQLLNGLKYLHERNIVHRDIKPENILLCDKNLTVKLGDFGLAKIIGEDSFTTSLCGTPSYVAPEILEYHKNRKYSRAVDVWSLGVVLYICLCGFPPFSDELYSEEFPYNLAEQIKQGLFEFPSPYWDPISDGALDLIDRMLTVDPEKRITVQGALEHPWVKEPKSGAADSAESLSGAFCSLGFSRKKVERERTLLSNAVKNSRKKPEDKKPVTIHQEDGSPKENGTANESGLAGTTAATTAFMKVGGKGVNETLFGETESGRSDKPEFPLF